MALSPEVEIELLKEDIARERRELEQSERSKEESRVTDEALWLATLARRRERIETMEGELAELQAKQRAADEAYEGSM